MTNARTRFIAPVSGVVLPVTLAEAKAQCRVTCDDEDTLIQAYLQAATMAASDRLQRSLAPAQYRLTLDRFPSTAEAIELLLPPVTSVAAVTYTDEAGTSQTLAAQDYILDAVSEPARLLPAVDVSWPATQDRVNAVQVDYTAGYPTGTVPIPIKQWILLAVGDLYEQRSRSTEKPVVPQFFAESLLDTYKIWSV